MKDVQYPLNFSSLVAHAVNLSPDSNSKAVRAAFNDCPTGSIAVTDNDKHVVGLLTNTNFFRTFSSDPSSSVKEAMSENYTIVKLTDSPESVIDRALNRGDGQIGDDLILVDDDNCLIGLVPVSSLLRLQKSNFLNRTETHTTANNQPTTKQELEAHLEEAKTRLSNAKSVAEQMDGIRSEFMIKFGFEARTSITSVMGMINLLSETNMSQDQLRMIRSATSSSLSLLRLVDSVLDCSRIELDNFKLAEAVFNPVKTIQQAIQNTREEAEEKDLVLEFKHEAIAPEILGDEKRYQQIVKNLLGQSINQTNSGGIVVKLSQEASPEGIILRTEILDTGTKILEWNADDVFNLFENKPKNTLKDDLVTLVSCRIAEKLGGNIAHHDSDTKAPRYVFEVPFALPEKGTQSAPMKAPVKLNNTPDHQLEPRPLEILVVDDDRLNLRVSSAFLSKNNCKVHLAMSGREAIEILSDNPIDGILMDCQMPELSGCETTELIRAGEAGEDKSNVFIVAVTANDTRESENNCKTAGMNDFLAKPVRARGYKELVAEIRHHVNSPL